MSKSKGIEGVEGIEGIEVLEGDVLDEDHLSATRPEGLDLFDPLDALDPLDSLAESTAAICARSDARALAAGASSGRHAR